MAGFLLWRYLADSNRRTRFCRPIPSHSVKVPFAFADAKVMDFLESAYMCVVLFPKKDFFKNPESIKYVNLCFWADYWNNY